MSRSNSIASQTRNNWFIDTGLFVGALIASLTGIYFLFLPVGGYQGGRNPMYGIVILFERHTWEDLHLWFGILMIVAAVVHILVHWKWIVSMVRRILYEITHWESRFNNRSRINLLINAAVGISFFVAAISGIYLLFVPGGRTAIADPEILFSRNTWDLIHTWSGILMINAAVVHFAIHWKWTTKVTQKIFMSLKPRFWQTQSTKTVNS
jgi:hypothetical protein